MIKNVFFDFNGTLIDDIDLTLDIENKLLVQRGLNAVTKEFYLDNFCFPVINYYKKSGFDLTKINFSELNAEFMNEYTERFLKDSKLFDDVEITLKKLKENGYKDYIYSASEINLLISQLKYFGIYNYFDGIIASTNIEAHTKLDYGRDYIKEHLKYWEIYDKQQKEIVINKIPEFTPQKSISEIIKSHGNYENIEEEASDIVKERLRETIKDSSLKENLKTCIQNILSEEQNRIYAILSQA